MLGLDHSFTRRLIQWYQRDRRKLPWRINNAEEFRLPEPYYVLVSEAMLQQTQVATVIPYFQRFIERFPTLQSLAVADEQTVLRLWQGLGYYSRARNLRRAAQAVMADHGGNVPQTAAQLLKLPGVGRYTAGAVASLAFDTRAPIVDGNVARVLCRLDKIESDPRDKKTQAILWARAEALLPERRASDFNSALMELGAMICTPRAPKCLLCPVRDHCEAARAGMQEQIPRPRKALATPIERRLTFCIRRADDRYLIEQRPARGRWAGMWQFVTVVRPKGPIAVALRAAVNRLPVRCSNMQPLGRFSHGLTHRQYRFEAFEFESESNDEPADSGDLPTRSWATLDELADFPLPRPHVRLAEQLRKKRGVPGL